MNKVSYGGHTYEQAGLSFGDLLTFGSIITPRLAGLASTAGAIVSDKAVVSSEVYSFYQTIERVFSPSEWETLIKLFVFNEGNMLVIDGESKTTDEVEEHFRGDLLRLYYVAVRLAVCNLGESETFMNSLTGYVKNIADSLTEVVKGKLGAVEKSLSVASEKSSVKSKKQ